MRKISWVGLGIFLLAFGASCATSPLGRKQFIIVPDSEMDQMGAQAFEQIKGKESVETNSSVNQYINCIVKPITEAARNDLPVSRWDVAVFRNKEANAFALPGGKIGVYTGLLQVAETDAQLATVIGHEVGHVIARHGAERVSESAGTELGVAALGSLAKNNPNRQLLVGLLGVGAQVGILLPFSRTQESEADIIGLRLMSSAGFDPQESVRLWQNMIKASGGRQPLEFLSTHPASQNRIHELENQMPDALSRFRKSARKPQCDRSLLNGISGI